MALHLNMVTVKPCHRQNFLLLTTDEGFARHNKGIVYSSVVFVEFSSDKKESDICMVLLLGMENGWHKNS